jgi:hypothetical protein
MLNGGASRKEQRLVRAEFKVPKSAPPPLPAHTAPPPHSHRAVTAAARREIIEDATDARMMCSLVER